jgi:hypothetical protein
MATYHLHIKALSRANKYNALAASAYRSATRLRESLTGKEWDFRKKRGVISSELFGWRDKARSQLWNAAERAEKKSNAVVAREIEASIPQELNDEQAQDLALTFAAWLRDTYGVALEYSLHQPGGRSVLERRPHVHFLMTTRRSFRDENKVWRLGEKTREWDDRYTTKEPLRDENGKFVYAGIGKKRKQVYVEKLNPGLPTDTDENGRPLYGPENTEFVRQAWEQFANAALDSAGFDERIDRRTLKEQGLDKEAVHRSRNAVEVSTKTGELTPQLKEMKARERRNMLQEVREATTRGVPLPVIDYDDEIEQDIDETPGVDQEQAKAERWARRKQAQQKKYNRFAEAQIAATVAHHRAAEEREAQEKAKAETAPPTKPQAKTTVKTAVPQKTRRYPTR